MGRLRNRLEHVMSSPLATDANETLHEMMTHENAGYAKVWSVVEAAYWTFCLAMSLVAPDFSLCRAAYAIALAMSLVALACMSAAPKNERVVRTSAVLIQTSIIVAGTLIAGRLAPKTIVVFASTLLIPVMFIQPTATSASLLVSAMTLFAVTGRNLDPDTYFWVLSNQAIFSSIGIILGHVVNRTRFERHTYAESAMTLARQQSEFARRDQLTGLGNRLAYHETLEALAGAPQEGTYVIIADIDRLKTTNDSLGHEAGDELIAGAATIIRETFSDTDLAFRTGGDEFCIIGIGDEERVRNLIQALSDTCAQWHGTLCDHISMSCGFALTRDGRDVEAAMTAADADMYAHKHVRGR